MKFPASPLQILLADDEAVARLALTELWKQKGYSVESVEDGDIALRRAQEKSFDLICLDYQMPVVEGWQVAENLRKSLGPVCPVMVAVSSMKDIELQRQCLESGMSAFYLKPVGLEQIDEMIQWVPYPLDKEKLWAQFGQIPQVLRTITEEFLLRGPQSVTHLKEIFLKDPQDPVLRRAAHTLKGTVSYFYAGPTAELAKRIQEGQGSNAVLQKLEAEVERLCFVLNNLQLEPS